MKTDTIIKIRGYHIDHFGHVNHARYIEFLEEARWDYMETNNLINLFHQTKIIHVVAGVCVKYKKSARAYDTIKIKTYLEKAAHVSFTMGQNIFLDNTLIVEAEITNVFIDINHQNTIKPDKALISGWPDLCSCLNSTRSNSNWLNSNSLKQKEVKHG